MTPSDLLWALVKDRVFCTREEYEASLEGWTQHPIYRGGVLAAVVITKGNEIHCAVDPVFRGRWLGWDLEHLLWPGQVTRTAKSNTIARRFIERLGFRLTHEDDYDAHYLLETPAYRAHHRTADPAPEDVPHARALPGV